MGGTLGALSSVKRGSEASLLQSWRFRMLSEQRRGLTVGRVKFPEPGRLEAVGKPFCFEPRQLGQGWGTSVCRAVWMPAEHEVGVTLGAAGSRGTPGTRGWTLQRSSLPALKRSTEIQTVSILHVTPIIWEPEVPSNVPRWPQQKFPIRFQLRGKTALQKNEGMISWNKWCVAIVLHLM